jgi:hypothetical protein
VSTYTTAAFWKATAERALKTAAQVALALLSADHLLGVLDVDWQATSSATLLAALLSVLSSIASAKISSDGSPSLGGEVVESNVVEHLDGTEVVAGPANELVAEGHVVREVTPEHDDNLRA